MGKFYFINIQCIPKQINGDDPQQLSSGINIALVALRINFKVVKLDAQYLYVVLGKPSCRPKITRNHNLNHPYDYKYK